MNIDAMIIIEITADDLIIVWDPHDAVKVGKFWKVVHVFFPKIEIPFFYLFSNDLTIQFEISLLKS